LKTIGEVHLTEIWYMLTLNKSNISTF